MGVTHKIERILPYKIYTFTFQGLFAISTGIIFASRNVVLVILATGTTGLLLTTIQVLPYSLISQYQKDATVSYKHHVFPSKNIF